MMLSSKINIIIASSAMLGEASHAQQQQLLRTKPSQSNKQYRELDSSVSAWWVDWDNTRCVGNCIGPPPCGDRAKGSWTTTHATIEECCGELYGSLFEGDMLRECAEGAPVVDPSAHPSKAPTETPSKSPVGMPTTTTSAPSKAPTLSPVISTDSPTKPTMSPILGTDSPTASLSPTRIPTQSPETADPTNNPSDQPTHSPSKSPSTPPTSTSPTTSPTKSPTLSPIIGTDPPTASSDPAREPSHSPSRRPTNQPTTSPSAHPTKSPSVNTTVSPTLSPVPSSDPSPQLKYVGNNGNPSSAFPLANCQGDCDTDDDCQGSLQCFQRWNNEAVPGCAGEDSSKTDYCCNRPDNYLWFTGNNGEPADKFPLGHCEGDCDDDDECEGSMICEMRSGFDEVPGCMGIGRKDKHYCRFSGTSYYEYEKIGTCETGQDKWQGPAPFANKSNLAISFFAFGDTPYDDACSECNTCIGIDGNKEDSCTRFDCILKSISMSELPVNNTCTYEGPDYECLKQGIIPYLNAYAGDEAAFVAHVGDIMKGDPAGGNRRCNQYSFASRRDLFSNASNFLIVPGDNDWNECYGYDINSNTDPIREMWRNNFANVTSPFNQFSRDFPEVMGGGRPFIERQATNPENFHFVFNDVAFFGLNSVKGSSHVEDVAPEDLNAVWVENSLEIANCTIKSIVLIAHMEPSSDVDTKLDAYFNRCGSNLPTLLIRGDRHPMTYCMSKSGGRLKLTVEAFQSGPLLVSVIRDPASGADYFHVHDSDPADSNENCASQPVTPSPTAPIISKPTYSPNAFGATYVPGDLQVPCDGGSLTLSKGMDCKLLTTEGQLLEYANGTLSQEKMHSQADGAGVIEHPDGGWFLVSNSEIRSGKGGGAGTLRFDAKGDLIGYEKTLTGTTKNCGGGLSYWNTWISCEENGSNGHCFEVDPHTGYTNQTKVVDQGGNYESFAYDNQDPDVEARFFTTEDHSDGALVRYTPHMDAFMTNNSYDILTTENGTYDFLVLNGFDGTFTWSPNRADGEASATALFPNTEGIDIHNRILNFVSKKNKELFTLDLAAGTWIKSSTRSGAFDMKPDQLGRIIGDGVLYFCEEGGAGQSDVHARDVTSGEYYTILTGDGYNTETTGLAFSPDNMFMYVSFQADSNIYSFWRTDGLPFHGAVAYTKYHAAS